MRTAEIARWINEREAIRMRKAVLEDYAETGKFELSVRGGLAWCWGEGGPTSYSRNDPKVWTLKRLTADPILGTYRFCNVRREDDRVTRWIREHIILPYINHEYLWLMLCIARTINWPDSLADLMLRDNSWPRNDSFDPDEMGDVLQQRKNEGQKVYTGSYMIRAESDPRKPWYLWSKQRYIAEIVIGTLWKNRHDWLHLDADGTHTSQGVWDYLQLFTGWGPFMAYQVIVDMQHTQLLETCFDKQSWAAAGPGTKRGLNRWVDKPAKEALSQTIALERLIDLRHELNQPTVIWPWLQPIDLSDVCNVCCEFDKYERVRLGEGEPRAKYVHGRGY